jgi:hypothetical protein
MNVDNPILLLALIMASFAACIWTGKGFIHLLKQPLPSKKPQPVSGPRIVVTAVVAVASAALTIWFFFVVEPSIVVTLLISIVVMVLMGLNLRREAAKRAKAARTAAS